MTLLPWLGPALGGLVILVIGLRAVGAARWTTRVRRQTTQLDAGTVPTHGRLPSPAHFDARELEGLPAPVQRYFRAVLTDGQPIIAAASIEMTGSMNMSATAAQWKPFTSRQRVVTHMPGFLWDARVHLFPGAPVFVGDSYIAGHGSLIAKLFGLFTVAELQGKGEIAHGEFMRYFAESPWYPTALLPSQGVQWQAVDPSSANATIVDAPITLTLLFRFDEAGLITSVQADSRGAGVGKDGAMEMLPWVCTFSAYRQQDGMQIPMTGEAARVRPEGRKTYFVGHVRKLHHEFLP